MKLLLLTLLLAVASFAQAAHSVSLSWVDTGNPAGTTYNVYRGTGACQPSTAFAKIGSLVAAKAYTDNSVAGGTTYCYQVTATNGTSESGPSPQASAAVPLLSAPTSIVIVAQ